jgi:hypothetical protein
MSRIKGIGRLLERVREIRERVVPPAPRKVIICQTAEDEERARRNYPGCVAIVAVDCRKPRTV